MTDLIGIPYKIHGRDESGLDCFGLIWLIAKRKGTPIKDPIYKGFNPSLSSLADEVGLIKTKPDTGCVLEIEKEGRLHLGYSLDRKRMIHSTFEDGVIIDDIVKYKVKGYYTFIKGSKEEK